MTAILIFHILFALALLIQFFYWGVFFMRFAHHQEKEISFSSENALPISVVICAKNEQANLSKNLPSILEQDYPEFEVLVVNDNSTDGTAEILARFQGKHSHLKVVELLESEKKSPGKKAALAKGIRASNFDICLLTDADCQPNDAAWIQKMSSVITAERTIGLGYGPYYFQKGWLNKFIRFETVYTAIQYFSFAIWKIPYMGVGRNLIYNKSIFLQNDGFKNHESVASGDDDLFINEVANENNVGIQLSPQSFVSSEGKKNIRNYFIQKKRHLSTGKHYRPKHQILLGLLSMSHFMIFLLFILSLGFNLSSAVYGTLLIIRSILVVIVYKKVLNKLGEQELWRWILLLDVSLLLYYILFTPALMLGNTKTWK